MPGLSGVELYLHALEPRILSSGLHMISSHDIIRNERGPAQNPPSHIRKADKGRRPLGQD
jgi:hypothetical protein